MGHPSSDDLLTSLKFNAIVTIVLYFKMHYCFMYLGHTRMTSGTRAPEDTYQPKPSAEEKQKALQDRERAERMSGNDMENIFPFMFLMWGSYFCLGQGTPSGTWVHNIAAAVFAAARFLHTLSYAKKLSYARSAGYALGQVACIVLVVNTLLVLFNQHDH